MIGSPVSLRRCSAAVTKYVISSSAHGGIVAHRGDRGAHVMEPPVALGRSDGVREVPHPQAGMATLVGVRRGPAPVLGEEQRQPVASAREVGLLGIQREQHVVGGHAGVERVDEALEERHAADPENTAWAPCQTRRPR